MSRIAILKKDNCRGGRECPYMCQKYCPRVRTGDETIVVGEDGKPIISEQLCVGCGICVKKCDFDAISIVNLPEALDSAPVHQYGVNAFRLFRLPVPKKGNVVGLIGENGIGKSTAIKILSGSLIPNLSNFTEKGSWDNVLEHYAGTELFNYFEDLQTGNITVSYKPQYVTNLPKLYKKSLGELLEQTDETGRMKKYTDYFELKHLLDHTLDKLSGGELQRATIAAALSKDASVFFLDEPSSFLDIRQRLRIAKAIRELAAENKAVLLVEHDLVILDYLTDFIHLLYGKVGAFGVVSLLKNSRVGINTYLSGYLRDENVRFRDDAIKFEAKPPIESIERETLLSFETIKKTLGTFSLEVNAGEVFAGETIGILGPNGIGKTTFVKILAGVIDSDEGEASSNEKVSYKPQYLQTDSEKMVRDVLSEASDQFGTGWYSAEIIKPLQLEKLLLKQIKTLSGGELQRVAIGRALSQDARLFLLDEPSAYLDVEQRIIVGKVVRRIMEQKNATALIVDHDLLFLDYLSNRLMVFNGNSGVYGNAVGPMELRKGMNSFLKDTEITFRRDHESRRPRANKTNSRKDIEQKASGEYYYAEV